MIEVIAVMLDDDADIRVKSNNLPPCPVWSSLSDGNNKEDC